MILKEMVKQKLQPKRQQLKKPKQIVKKKNFKS